MKVYINNILIECQVLPSETPTLDETLETFSFSLIESQNGNPYAPMQDVRLELENTTNEVLNFVLISDSVDTFSLNPLRYIHNITCSENIRKLSKYLVRNSVFTLPAQRIKKSYNAESMRWTRDAQTQELTYVNFFISAQDLNNVSEPLKLYKSSNIYDCEKIEKATFKINFQFWYGSIQNQPDCDINIDARNKTKINAFAPYTTNIQFSDHLILRYKDSNNQTVTTNIYPSEFGLSDWTLNVEYNFPRIKQLADQGCNNFELLFPDLLFLTSTSDPGDQSENDIILGYAVQIEITANTYYHSCYDVLALLKIREEEIFKTTLFELPENNDLYELLNKTPAPNFTFTQNTLFECIAEVFRIFDAIFTMDSNGVLGITYFNDIDKVPLSNPKFTGKNAAISEERYTNGLVTYYQDGRTIERFPSNNSFAKLRTEGYGVPNQDDHVFLTPHPIYSVIKCEVLSNANIDLSGNGQPFHLPNFPIDITRQVIEQSIWTLLDTAELSGADWDNFVIKQANSIYYSKGTNSIQCAYNYKSTWGIIHYAFYDAVLMALCRMLGLGDNQYDHGYSYQGVSTNFQGTWNAINMRVTYETNVDGRTQIESLTHKFNGTTLVDQNNGAVDLNKMGLNILGLSLKLGEPSLNLSHKITTWNNRIKIGDVLNINNEIWVANVCSYTFLSESLLNGKITFVKNFNALSLRTRLLREKRFSNIASELVQKSESNFIEYIYVSTDENNEGETISFNYLQLSDCLYLSLKNDGANNTNISFASLSYNSKVYYLPLIVYGSGNMVCFEMSYDSPISAGNQTRYETAQTWFGTNKYYTAACRYTDDEGFLYEATVNICQATSQLQFDELFPDITSAQKINIATLPNFKFCKQPNEILALNYELAFLPLVVNRDFVGNEFINHNFFTEGKQPKNLYIYVRYDTFKYSVLDTEGSGTSVKAVTAVSSTALSSSLIRITLTHESVLNNEQITSWSVCNEEGKILFAFNKTNGTQTQKNIYFITRKTRFI